MDKFRIGIIGAGHIAEKMAVTLAGMPEVEAYGVASRDRAKAEDFAVRFNFSKAFGSYAELADDSNVDLIYVATPHTFHFEHVTMCLTKGKPVLCEKAFMANAREAEKAVELSESKGVFLAEAMWTRYLPFYRTVAEKAADGTIGRPMMITAHLGYPVSHKERIVRPELGGGALLDLGVYPINFALHMFGKDIRRITSHCTVSDTGVDMQDNICFEYEDGRMAVLMATALCANDRQGIISGSRGYIVTDNINNTLRADIYDKDHNLVETLHAPEQITGFEYQVRACIDAISKGLVETPFMPHSESVAVMRILDCIRDEAGVTFPNDRK